MKLVAGLGSICGTLQIEIKVEFGDELFVKKCGCVYFCV